ncbi:DNA-directed RNA polymerase III subunit RPC4, partial [Stegodyphus mimosarum]
MSEQPNEDKKPDFSNIPRGAIGIKGLPISRNTRLPSIRSPRDLMLGAQPKRTFVPNIPVRREKKPLVTDKDTAVKPEEIQKTKIKHLPSQNDRGRGRGRGRGQIIQTQGSVFGEGLSMDIARKDKSPRETIPRIRGLRVKQEKMETDVSDISEGMSNIFTDNFIDDGDDDDFEDALKPVLFPLQNSLKNEEKKEIKKETLNFENEDIAKEMGYDIKQVAKFIKKEKGVEEEEIKEPDVPQNRVSKFFTSADPQLLLLQFPQCITAKQKNDELDSDRHPKAQVNTENIPSNDQKMNTTSLSALPEGLVGKFQVLKSGKARLVFGSLNFDLDSINSLCSRHEVASVKTSSNSGDIVVLGNMEYKMKF